MILDPNQKEYVKVTADALRVLNDGLAKMRQAGIACKLQEHDGRYYLDAAVIVKSEHYA